MSRVPNKDASVGEFAQFTFDSWRDLDGYYEFYVRRWRRTLEFLRSQHWNALKEFDIDDLPEWKRFPVMPFVLSLYTDFLTQWLQSPVRYTAIPTSPDPDDISSAELFEQVMKYEWDQTNMEKHRIDLGAWLMSTGTAVLRVFWDTNTGDMLPLAVPTPQGGVMPVNPETFEPDPSMREPFMVDKGDIGVEVISPQFVRWGRSEQEGVMLGLLLTEDEVSQLYGEEAVEDLSFSESHAGMASDLSHINRPRASLTDEKRALVIEHYLPKSSTHPKGLWWTASSGGQKLLTRPNPLPGGVVPIVSFRWVPIPGEPHIGMSPLYDITFSNKIYDEILARTLEWMNKMMPKWLLKSGGGLSPGDMSDEPYQELVVHQGAEPELLEVANIPADFFQVKRDIRDDIMTTAGKAFQRPDERTEGTARGGFRNPPERKEGSETALAQINSKQAWERLGEVIASYVAHFYTEERVIGIQGPDKQFQWRTFKGTDLEDLDATIKVDETSLYPWNRQSIKDTVMNALQSEAGQLLFMDESGGIDKERLEGAVRATGMDVAIDFNDPDVLEARNEHVAFQNLQQGQEPPQPESWQNHMVHHDEHSRILKSLKFQSWPPHARQAFLQHVEQTEEILNQQAQEESEAMIEQERKLRQVREQAELEANVREEWATAIIEQVVDALGLSIDELIAAADPDVVASQGGPEAAQAVNTEGSQE